MKVRISNKDPKMRRRIRRLVRKHGLDRRKVYCVGYFGELATVGRATGDCSGCSCDCGDGYGCSHGAGGCEECGYTGKRVQTWPDPVLPARAEFQLNPLTCHQCKQPMAHFDAGCAPCAAAMAAAPVVGGEKGGGGTL